MLVSITHITQWHVLVASDGHGCSLKKGLGMPIIRGEEIIWR
jgi:hypothetical protein